MGLLIKTKEVQKVQQNFNNSVTLYNADCLDVFKELWNESVDLIVTDPPYRMTARGNHGNTGGMLAKKQGMIGKVFEYNDISPSAYASKFYNVLKEGGHCYVMTNHVNLIEMLNSFTKVGFHFIKSLIWEKDNKIMGTFYMSQFEYILFFRKGRGVPINNCGTSDILKFPNVKHKGADGSNLHDTEKPTGLMKVLIENSSQVGDTVLDPFMGVGSTGVASVKSGRKFIGIEIDEKYFKIAQERIGGI